MNIKEVFLSLPVLSLLSLTALTASAETGSSEDWDDDLSIYGLAAGMSGDVAVGPVSADVDLSFGDILENLEMGAMGSFRVGRGDWAFTTDLIYMGLGTSKGDVKVDLDQLVIEPTLSYRFNERFELLAGMRLMDISTTIRGPGIVNPDGGKVKADKSWGDAIVGGNFSLPISGSWMFNLRADVGGGGSDLTWQAFPNFSWYFSETGLLNLGFRWVYTDYQSGSDLKQFRYDLLTTGPQVGVKFHF